MNKTKEQIGEELARAVVEGDESNPQFSGSWKSISRLARQYLSTKEE